MNTRYSAVALLLFIIAGCQKKEAKQTFRAVVESLDKIEGLEVLRNGNAMVAVSGPYQGRVFTSSSQGMDGRAYGYINQKVIDAGNSSENMAALCGESRMWFGPQYGEYSIFFDPGDPQIDEYSQISPDLNHKKFRQLERTANTLTYGNDMNIRNAAGYVFELYAERKISLLGTSTIEQKLGVNLSDEISSVGFSAETTIRNIGNEQWKKENGLLGIWELGCMLTSPDNLVIIPMARNTDSITTYFTPAEERIKIEDQVLYYKADARYMNKIGLLPRYCKNIMGSYSHTDKQLNIVTFTLADEPDLRYVNSVPDNKDPYAGDIINIFNGEVNVSMDYKWPFYEFESSSSAKELRPDEQLHHKQTTFHFEGSVEALNRISQKVLGVDLKRIPDF